MNASSGEALEASARVFGRVSFLSKNRDDILKLLGDPETVSDYNKKAENDPNKPLVYIFDSGFGGCRYTLMFRNGVCTSVEAEDLE